MRARQREFIEFALQCGVLSFGQFVLKSGRPSPYFFNSGLFSSGARLARLGRYYADAIVESDVAFDMLYGAAYKGIPLVSAVAIALAEHHGRDVGWSFNRKEAKDHGEKGRTVGAPLAGRVMIVDDVISAGTSTRESVALIRRAGAEPVALAVSMDRQERGQGALSAAAEAAQGLGLTVISVISLDALRSYLGTQPGMEEQLARMDDYRARFAAPAAEAGEGPPPASD